MNDFIEIDGSHAEMGSPVKEWLGTVTWRTDVLAKSLGKGKFAWRIYRLLRDAFDESDRKYVYTLQLSGRWQDIEAKAKEACRRIEEALLPTEHLECSGHKMTVVGKGYVITYYIEGCGKQAAHTVCFDGDSVRMAPLHRMGIYLCRYQMARRGVSEESVRALMDDSDFKMHFQDHAERFVAIYKWLTGRLVFKSDATRAAELISRGEGTSVEFKAASSGVHDDVFETICSFANGVGGDIILGVNDRGNVIGLPRGILNDVKRQVKQTCSSKGNFSKPVRVGVQELIVNRRRIVHIQVPRMKGGVLYKDTCFVRQGDSDFRCP